MWTNQPSILIILSASLIFQPVQCEERVVRLIYSVNAGGPDHRDSNGVFYKGDTLQDGVASDYGKRLTTIGRVQPQDEILYRTERYSDETFGYDFKLFGDGQYVLVMKFCEVYFQSAGKKVFDITLNKKHTILEEFDIYAVAGFGTAHQEIVPFIVSNHGKTLSVNGKTSAIKKDMIRLEFVKGRYDNPKINAFYVVMGNPEDIPRLPADRRHEENEMDMEMDEDDDEYLDLGSFTENSQNNRGQMTSRTGGFRRYKRSGAFVLDPWWESSVLQMMLPIIVAVGTGVLSIGITIKLFKGIKL